MKKKLLNYLILIVIILLSLKVLFGSIDPIALEETLQMADGRFLLLAIGCMFIYWGLEAEMMHNLIKKVNPEIGFWTAVKTTIIGQYYSFLTPFASGGQPMQLYELGKSKIPMGNATAVLVGKFLLFQVTVTIYSMFLFIFRLHGVITGVHAATTFVMIGLTINTTGLAVIILMAFKPKKMERIAQVIIEGLHKAKLLKHKERAYKRLNHWIEEYQLAMTEFHGDLKNNLWLFALSVVQLTAFFSVTYLVYLALGLRGASFLDIVSLQAMLYMAVSFIPSPGTAGASEVGFSLLLGSIFSSHLLAMAILLWRGISYYFGLIFCGLFTLYVYVTDKERTTNQTS